MCWEASDFWLGGLGENMVGDEQRLPLASSRGERLLAGEGTCLLLLLLQQELRQWLPFSARGACRRRQQSSRRSRSK